MSASRVHTQATSVEAEPKGARPRLLARGLIVSLLLHAGLGLALVLQLMRAEPAGGGGTVLEAISVELVDASALEARAAVAPSDASVASQPVDAGDGVPAAAGSAAADSKPVETETVHVPPPFRTTPAPAPAAPERDGVEPAPVAAAAPPRTTDDVPEHEPQPESQASSSPAPSGGASARGNEARSEMAAQAAANPGELRRFAAAVSQALQAARQKDRLAGRRGTVLVTFSLSQVGALDQVRIDKASGSDTLDEAALRLIRRTSFPRPPDGSSSAQLTFTVPIEFR